jgi:hypothetical protein
LLQQFQNIWTLATFIRLYQLATFIQWGHW